MRLDKLLIDAHGAQEECFSLVQPPLLSADRAKQIKRCSFVRRDSQDVAQLMLCFRKLITVNQRRCALKPFRASIPLRRSARRSE
jgi:hypothetical protein